MKGYEPMSHKIWEINGISLELDLEDADVMERLENAFETMKNDESAVPKDGKSFHTDKSVLCYVPQFVQQYFWQR